MIAECKSHCSSSYQDNAYGRGMRVHNPTLKSGSSVIRCTVCGNERGKPGIVTEEKKKKK